MIRYILIIFLFLTFLLAKGQEKELSTFTPSLGSKSETVTDIDGNEYPIVVIGTQTWMAGNLRATKYSNGDNIDNVTANETWVGLSSGAYSLYNNDFSTYGQHYGALYNWFAVADERNLCPDGWHIPTDGEWKQLEMFLGMSSTEADATGYRGTTEGGELKSTRIEPDPIPRWDWPNTGATDEFGFSGLPAGFRRDDNGAFSYTGLFAYWWTSSESTLLKAWSRGLSNSEEKTLRNEAEKVYGYSVRCIKDVEITSTLPTVTTTSASSITQTTATLGGNVTSDGGASVTARGVVLSTSENPTVDLNEGISSDGIGLGEFVSSITGLSPSTLYYIKAYATNSEGTAYGEELQFTTLHEEIGETVTDIDGNEYPIVVIGTQTWMAGNLKTTKYNDDTPIDYPGADNTAWTNATAGAYAWYSNDIANKAVYGALYNWLAVETGKLCPEGWHVPSDDDWMILEAFLGIPEAELNTTGARGTDQGGMLKATGTDYWNTPNTGATNSTGFSAVGHGVRYASNGNFAEKPYYGYFWTSTPGSYYTNAVTRGMSYSDAKINRYDISGKNDGRAVRCVKDAEVMITLPTVTTASALDITQTSATSGGNVTSDGGASVTARGVVWSTSENPTLESNEGLTSDGSGTGEFSSSITGLTANTLYYVKAYATNSEGTAYGEQVSFTTLMNAPEADFTVDISEGLAPLTVQFTDQSTNAPDSWSWNFGDGGTSTQQNPSHSYTLAGTYTVALTVTNAGGSNTTTRTDLIVVHSPDDAIVDIDGNTYPIVEIGTQTWMAGNLKTTKYNDDAPIDYPGADNAAWTNATAGAYAWYSNDIANKVVYGALYNWLAVETGKLCPEGWHVPSDNDWMILEAFLGIPEAELNTTGARGTDQGGMLKATGTDYWNTPNTGATNSTGFSAVGHGVRYASNGNFAERPYFGYFWTSTPGSYYTNAVTRGMSYSDAKINRYDISGKNDGRAVRCVKDAEVMITLPTVTTASALDITQTSVTTGGNVTSDGGASVTARGVVWSTSENPTLESNEGLTSDGSGTGEFSSSITGLTANTLYYVKAYATNSEGTAYGEQISFNTLEETLTQEYASLPFAEGFDNAWINRESTRDVPSVYWKNNPATGDNSWRRNDDGASAGWYSDGGTYTPSGANSTSNSARFHSYNAYPSGVEGILDLHLDFSTKEGSKTLSFWYINISGTDKLEVFVSENGGESFGEAALVLETTTSWEEKVVGLGELSASEGVIRFKAISDWGYSDIGLDEISVQVETSITVPTIITTEISEITQSTATGGGDVTDEGGANVTARGVVWSTSQNPTLESNDGQTTDGSGVGFFVSSLTSLNPNTLYYVRAYATNSEGTGYGNEVTFSTLEEVDALTLPFSEGFEGTTFPPSGWNSYIGTNGLGTNQSWFRLNTTSNSGAACAAINFENVDGGMAEDWLVTPKIKLNASNNKLKYFEKQSYSSDYASQFKIKVSTTSQTDHSTFSDVFTYTESDFGTTWTSRTIDLDNFANQNVYIAIVYLNDDGDNWMVDDIQVYEDVIVAPVAAFTASVTSGYVPLTVNFTDQSTNNPTSWNWNFGDGSTSTLQNPSHTYTVAGVYTVTLTATNSGGTDSETKSNYISANPIVLPSITTTAVTSITQTSAISGGNVTNNGGASVTSRGVVWGTIENPTLESSTGSTSNGSGSGIFTSNITGLVAGTTYYVRAYATNISGTAYGNQISLTTLSTSVDVDEFNSISAYPNPFENVLTIESEIGLSNICLINIIGQIVFNEKYKGEVKTTIDLNNIEDGIYILRVFGLNGKIKNLKVVKR